MNLRVIYKTISGSHLYGTARPDSDMDIRGVCLPPMTALLGLSPFEQHEVPGEDTVIYDLRKFCRLALNANPNCLELLWVPDDAILEIDNYGRQLLANRHLFLSTKVVYTYSGYAFAQLKRIEGHRRWLLNSPIEPTLGQFGGVLFAGQAKFPNQQKQQDYKAALRNWNDYQKWRRERNPARAKVESEFGLDLKHASHLVRLLCQGRTILTEPDKFCPRLAGNDLETVLAVLHGEWEYEKLVEWARQQEIELKVLADTVSPLPKKPRFNDVEKMVMEMLREYVETQP